MTIRIAINGLGRIGRNVVRALYESGRRAEITVWQSMSWRMPRASRIY